MAHAYDKPMSSNATNISHEDMSSAVPCGMFYFIIYGPLTGTACAFGLIGNSISFAVLQKYTPGNVGTYLLKALAIMDNLYLANVIGGQMYVAETVGYNMFGKHSTGLNQMYTYAWSLDHIAVTWSVGMIVLVAGNRYIAVCRPMLAPRLCTMNKVQLEILIMAGAAVIIHFPRFFDFRFVQHNVTTLDENNVTSWHEETTNVGLRSSYIYSMISDLSFRFFIFLVPLVFIIFFNIRLIQSLRVAQRNRRAIVSPSSNDENNLTLVMIVIIIVFVVCQAPMAIFHALLYYTEPHSSNCAPFTQYFTMSNLLLTMNSSVNFVIYCLFRRQFRNQLRMLLGCTCGRPSHTDIQPRPNAARVT